MPLIGSENQIWALLDRRKSRSCGKGFSSGASVARCAGCSPEQVVSSDCCYLKGLSWDVPTFHGIQRTAPHGHHRGE